MYGPVNKPWGVVHSTKTYLFGFTWRVCKAIYSVVKATPQHVMPGVKRYHGVRCISRATLKQGETTTPSTFANGIINTCEDEDQVCRGREHEVWPLSWLGIIWFIAFTRVTSKNNFSG